MERNRQTGPAPEWVEVVLRAVGEAVAARDAAWHACARMQELIRTIEAAEQERMAAFDADETALSEAEAAREERLAEALARAQAATSDAQYAAATAEQAARLAEDMAVEAEVRTRLPLS